MLTRGEELFVAVFTQALLYGIYLATLIQSVRWLIFTDEGWKCRQKLNPLMTFAVVFIFLMSTINLATMLKYEINQYIRKESWYKYGTVMTMNISESLGVIAIDAILTYRCWIVYSKSWLVLCVPTTIWSASLACSALFWYFTEMNYKSQTYSTKLAEVEYKLIMGLYACNIAITIYATTAIIYRILSTTRTSSGSPKRLNHVMRILAESGILYTSTLIFSLVGTLPSAISGNSTLVELLISNFSDALNFSMAGITFNLILIRVYKSRVELRDSLADSRTNGGEGTLSGMQFNNPQITDLSAEGPPSNAQPVDEVIDEIQEHRRISDGMDVISA